MNVVYKKYGIPFLVFFLAMVFLFKKPTRSLRVLAWQGSFTHETIDRFEKETGIKLHLSYFSTNEELLSKMALSKGKGIDVIVPSDYLIEKLYAQGYIQPLDQNRLRDLDQVYVHLLEDVTYKGKLFGLPLEFGIYGIAAYENFVEKNRIGKKSINESVYHVLFNPLSSPYFPRLCMTNDSATACVAAFLYGDEPEKASFMRENAILRFLERQHPFVTLYSDTKGGYALACDEVDMVFIQSDDFLRTALYDEKMCFYVHPFCSIKTVEYAALSSSTRCAEEAYEFLNFVFRKDVMQENMQQLRYLPVRRDLLDEAPHVVHIKRIFEIINAPGYVLRSVFDVLPEEERLKVWIKLKGSR